MKPILVLALLSLCGSAFSQVCLEKGGTDTCTPASDGPTHCVAASQFGGPGTYPQRCGWQGSNAPFIQCKSLTDAIDTWNAGVVHYHQNDLGLIICQPPGIHDIVQTRDIVNYGAKIQEYTFKSKFSYRGATTTCPATPPELSGSARCQTSRVCPPDASGNTTPASDGMCHVPKYEACPEGNPIQCAGGAKLQTEVDFSGSGLEFKRYYSSTGFFNPRPAPQVENGLGVVWRHSYQQSIYVRQAPVGSSDISVAYVLRPNDDYRNFSLVAGQWKGRLDKPEKLEELIAGGVRTGWRYTTESDVVELYDANGILLSMTRRDGRELNFTYSLSTTPSTIAPQAGLLIAITDDFGREIKLRYNAASLIKEMIDPSNVIFGYRYDVNNKLIAVDYPGGTSRAYLYNETGLVVSPNNLLPALTGIVSETGQRYGTYKYNGIGQTIQEWHGSSGTVDKLTVSYSSSYMNSTSTTLTTDALGTVRTKKFVRIGGAVKDAGIFEPCGTPGCSGNKFTNITYDSNG